MIIFQKENWTFHKCPKFYEIQIYIPSLLSFFSGLPLGLRSFSKLWAFSLSLSLSDRWRPRLRRRHPTLPIHRLLLLDVAVAGEVAVTKIVTPLGFARRVALILNAVAGIAAPPPILSLPPTPNPITPGNLCNLNTFSLLCPSVFVSDLLLPWLLFGCCCLELEIDSKI